MTVPSLSVHAAQERLVRAIAQHPRSIVAFDADGTLWSDDVGCIAFDYAVREGLLHEQAAEALGRICQDLDLQSPHSQSSTERARHLSERFAQGEIGDKLMAEIQVWAYAGLRTEEAHSIAEKALAEAPRRTVQKMGVISLVETARSHGARVVIVSASPEWVVATAGRELGFRAVDVIGGRARVDAGFIQPELDGDLPYGEAKVTALRQRFGTDPLVLATGDSGFDLHLLGAAELGLGVGMKPRLLSGIVELSHCFLLEEA